MSSAHSERWSSASSRSNRKDRKIARVVEPISLDRLEELLAEPKRPEPQRVREKQP